MLDNIIITITIKEHSTNYTITVIYNVHVTHENT